MVDMPGGEKAMSWWGRIFGSDQAAITVDEDGQSRPDKGNILRAATEYVCYKPIGQVADALVPGTDYIRIRVDRIHVPFSRIGTQQTHACFYAYLKVFHTKHLDVTIQTVSKTEIEKNDSSHAGRIFMKGREILGCVPFRGGLNFQIGLFTAQSQGGDLLDPYLDVVKEMSSAAGISLVSQALHFAKPIENAINRLLGGGRALSLEIGVDDTPSPVRPGTHLLVRARSDLTEGMTLNESLELVDGEGKLVTEFPYLVVTIDKVAHKDDWQRIPELRAAQDALRAEISRQKFGTNRKEVQKYVDAFRIACLLSDDLIEGDARYIAEQQQKKYDFEYPEKTLTAGSLVEPWALNDLNVEFSETVALAASGSDQAELNCEVY
jgi:hypothetical protein